MAKGKILVTGSTGLLGAHLLARMAGDGFAVAALRRAGSNMEVVREIFSFYTDDPDGWISGIEWRTGDLMDPGSLAGALDGIGTVINCAAIVSFDPRERNRIIRVNVQGTTNLVRGMEKEREVLLVHISSTSALGDAPGDDPEFRVDEETYRDPERWHTGYSVSKYESERVVRDAIREGLPAVILNPGIILGPGQWNKGSSQLFVQSWKGLRFFPYGGTGYVDVRDVVEIILECMSVRGGDSLPGQSYVVVGANLRYRDFFVKVTDEFGKPNPTVYAGRFMLGLAWRLNAPWAVITRKAPLITRDSAWSAGRIAFFSSEKVGKALGFSFRPIEETITWVCDQYKKKLGVR